MITCSILILNLVVLNVLRFFFRLAVYPKFRFGAFGALSRITFYHPLGYQADFGINTEIQYFFRICRLRHTNLTRISAFFVRKRVIKL